MKTICAIIFGFLLTTAAFAEVVTLNVRSVAGQVQIIVSGTPGDYYWVDVSDDGGATWDSQVYRVQAGEWFLPSTYGAKARCYRVSGRVE